MAERPPKPVPPTDPGAQSVKAALDAVRASRAELADMRRTRDAAMERTSRAIRKLRGEPEPAAVPDVKPSESLQERIDRITRQVEMAAAAKKR